MAESLLILGQLVGNGAQQTLYASPTSPSTQTVVSSIFAYNTHATVAKTIGVWVVKLGETAGVKNNVIPDGTILQPLQPYPITVGATLGPGDFIVVKGPVEVGFSAFGAQVT